MVNPHGYQVSGVVPSADQLFIQLLPTELKIIFSPVTYKVELVRFLEVGTASGCSPSNDFFLTSWRRLEDVIESLLS